MVEEIVLTEDQQSALDKARNWKGKALTIGGYAGTGKTTLIKEMLKCKEYAQWAVASFTGKAVDVLRNKGIDRAQTIHNLMYSVRQDKDTKELFFRRLEDLGRTGVIVDEASMVDMVLYRDLVKFGLPIIWVGDMGQLEPIGEDPRLMHDPEIRLEQIHRQALESPIVRLSMLIRQGAPLSEWFGTADGVELVMNRQNQRIYDNLVDFAAREGTMTICGFNKTRVAINESARRKRGYTEPVCKGDKVMCLANNKEQGAFNGMTGVVHEDPVHLASTTFKLKILTSKEKEPQTLKCDFGPVMDPKFNKKEWMYHSMERRKAEEPDDLTLWDHAYAITCHKAQGSEADEVAVWDQQCDFWESVRWRYTAVTRARKKLIYCV